MKNITLFFIPKHLFSLTCSSLNWTCAGRFGDVRVAIAVVSIAPNRQVYWPELWDRIVDVQRVICVAVHGGRRWCKAVIGFTSARGKWLIIPFRILWKCWQMIQLSETTIPHMLNHAHMDQTKHIYVIHRWINPNIRCLSNKFTYYWGMNGKLIWNVFIHSISQPEKAKNMVTSMPKIPENLKLTKAISVTSLSHIFPFPSPPHQPSLGPITTSGSYLIRDHHSFLSFPVCPKKNKGQMSSFAWSKPVCGQQTSSYAQTCFLSCTWATVKGNKETIDFIYSPSWQKSNKK